MTYVLLDTSLDNCWQRIQGRRRASERTIQRSYVEQLSSQYERLAQKQRFLRVSGNSAPVIVARDLLKAINT